MNNFFIDSNICVYAFDNSDEYKQQVAFNLLENKPFVSSQVVIEIYNACYKKLKIEGSASKSIVFKNKYQLSFLDATIVFHLHIRQELPYYILKTCKIT